MYRTHDFHNKIHYSCIFFNEHYFYTFFKSTFLSTFFFIGPFKNKNGVSLNKYFMQNSYFSNHPFFLYIISLTYTFSFIQWLRGVNTDADFLLSYPLDVDILDQLSTHVEAGHLQTVVDKVIIKIKYTDRIIIPPSF